MKITIYCDTIKSITFEDVVGFDQYGSVDHSGGVNKLNNLTIKLKDNKAFEVALQLVKDKFVDYPHTPHKFDDLIKTYDEEENKHYISMYYSNGYAGLMNPPQIHIS